LVSQLRDRALLPEQSFLHTLTTIASKGWATPPDHATQRQATADKALQLLFWFGGHRNGLRQHQGEPEYQL
jgi:hypothetical protein